MLLTAVTEVCPAPGLVKSSRGGLVFSEDSGHSPASPPIKNTPPQTTYFTRHFKGEPASLLLGDQPASPMSLRRPAVCTFPDPHKPSQVFVNVAST